MSRRPSLRALAALGLLFPAASAFAQLSYTGAPLTQDFNTLSNTAASSTLPTGWALAESGSGANATYGVDTGSSMSGNTYSYGSSASTDRAIGGLQSGSVNPTIGVQLSNASGAPITALNISYTGEQWRLGVLSRVDRMDFQYSTDATSLTTGTWTNADGLDFTAPVTTGTVGALDGNQAANRSAVSAQLAGLNVANGATLWLRWTDFNANSNDDGLAIDDITIGPPGDNPPTLLSSVPAAGASGVAVNSTISVTFSEPVSVSGAWFDFHCGAGTPTLTPSAGPAATYTFTHADLPFGRICNLVIDGSLVLDVDGTPHVLGTVETIQFETVADDLPSVLSTTPVDLAVDVARGANLQVVFSEPVNAPAAAFGIFCPPSEPTTRPFALSNDNNTTFILDPATDLPADTSCRLYVDNTLITDQDGTPDAPDRDTSITFTTADLLPPTVLSTFPVKDSTSFPPQGDMEVVFDLDVTLSPGAFALVCAQTTGIALTPDSSSGMTFTIDTGTTLVEGDTCTLTVESTAVTSGDGLNMAADEVVNFTVASSGAGNYYNGIDASSCAVLRSGLHELIDDHNVLPYSGDPSVWTMIEGAEEDPNNPNQVLDIYFNDTFVKGPITSGGARDNGQSHPQGTVYNREHTWPQSYGFASDTGNLGFPNAPRSDGHHLFASEKDWNADRGNKPFANCPPPGCASRHTLVHPVTGGAGSSAACDHASGNCNWVQFPDGNSGSFEVWNRRKGDVARGLLYLDVRYEGGTAGPGSNTPGQSEPDLILTDNRSLIQITSGSPAYMGLRSVLLQWHAQDPPDEMEYQRNNYIFSHQNNRNPFIDHPEWAECVFNCNCAAGGNQPPVANDATFNLPENSANGTVVGSVTATDPNVGDTLTYSITAGNASGAFTMVGSQVRVATSSALNYEAVQQFVLTVTVSDGALSDPATITVNLQNVNEVVANDDSFTLDEDSASTSLNVFANDVPDGMLPFVISSAGPALHGTVTFNAGGVEYAPAANYCGPDSFQYTNGNDTATVTMTVTCVNDAPAVASALPARSGQEGVAISAFSVATGFSDVDGDDLDFSQTGLASGLSLDAETGAISGTPDAGSASGSPYTVTITATDGQASVQQSFTFSITAGGVLIFRSGFEN